jgi:hypothetical protein
VWQGLYVWFGLVCNMLMLGLAAWQLRAHSVECGKFATLYEGLLLSSLAVPMTVQHASLTHLFVNSSSERLVCFVVALGTRVTCSRGAV